MDPEQEDKLKLDNISDDVPFTARFMVYYRMQECKRDDQGRDAGKKGLIFVHGGRSI